MFRRQLGLFEEEDRSCTEREFTLRGRLSREGIRGIELEVLCGICREMIAAGGPITMSELAPQVHLGVTAVQRLLGVLRGVGIVGVEKHPGGWLRYFLKG